MCREQTINAEANNRLRGIVVYADINSAVNRWLVTSTMRTHLLNDVLAELKCDFDDKSKELRNSRIAKDHDDLNSLRDAIGSMKNPFDSTVNPDYLFDIKTG